MVDSSILFPQPNAQWAQLATDLVGGVHTLRVNNIGGVTPNMFGAIGNGIADDTAAMQTAIEWSAAHNIPLYIPGGMIYRVLPKYESWSFRGMPGWSTPTRYCLLIDFDNLHIVGAGGKIVIGPWEGTANHLNFIFSTLQNLDVGTLKNCTMEGDFFDLDNTYSVGVNTYAAALIGIDDVLLNNLKVYNSTDVSATGRGHGFVIDNCRRVRAINCELSHVTQFINFSYCTDVIVDGMVADTFSEMIDMSFTMKNCVFNNIAASNSTAQQSQIIDTVGENIVISNVTVNNIAMNLFGIYDKPGWPTYREHVENHIPGRTNPETWPAVWQPTRLVSVTGVRGILCGYGAGASRSATIFVGNAREPDETTQIPVVSDITLSDIKLDQCSGFRILECDGLTLSDITLRNVDYDMSSDTDTYNAAIYMRQMLGTSAAAAFSKLIANVSNVRILGSKNGGFSCAGMKDGALRDIYVEDYGRVVNPSRGIYLSAIGMKPGNTVIENLAAIDTSVQPATKGQTFRASAITDFVAGTTISDMGGHRFVGATEPTLGGEDGQIRKYWMPRHQMRLGRVNVTNPNSGAAGGLSSYQAVILGQSDGKQRMVFAELIFAEAVPTPGSGGSVNNALRRIKFSDGSVQPIAAWVVNAAVPQGTIRQVNNALPAEGPYNTLSSGDLLQFTADRDTSGTGGFGVGVDQRNLILSYSSLKWSDV